MKVIIIEDEKLSAEHLSTLLHRIDNSITVVGSAGSLKSSAKLIEKHKEIDLLFVDIHLADGLSFELFSSLKIEVPVIFTTAYDQYAIQAFKVNSIDYLLKPIAVEDLEAALQKFKRTKKVNSVAGANEKLENTLHLIQQSFKNRFMVKMGDSIASIRSEEIAYFISEDGVVLLVTKEGKRYAVDYTLEQLEKLLDPKFYFRINRKVLIHIDCVKKVNSYFNGRYKISYTTLENDDGIVSRERVNEFKSWLDG